MIRQAVADAVSRPAPRPGIIPGDSAWALDADEWPSPRIWEGLVSRLDCSPSMGLFASPTCAGSSRRAQPAAPNSAVFGALAAAGSLR